MIVATALPLEQNFPHTFQVSHIPAPCSSSAALYTGQGKGQTTVVSAVLPSKLLSIWQGTQAAKTLQQLFTPALQWLLTNLL
jgi:hypothetical protein